MSGERITQFVEPITQFVERVRVTMEASPVPDNPHMEGTGELDKLDPERQHFLCVLTRGREHMQTYFSVGSGIIDRWVYEYVSYMGNVRPVPYTPDNNPHGSMRCLNAQVHTQNVKHRKRYRPAIEDVLDCLASDASGWENARGFEDWCSEYGYDTDSRRAEKTYRIIGEQSKRLRHLLGHDAYYELLWEVDRL